MNKTNMKIIIHSLIWCFFFALTISFILLMICGVSHAGTSFKKLGDTVVVVDWDKWLKEKEKAEEYARKEAKKARKGAFVITSSLIIE